MNTKELNDFRSYRTAIEKRATCLENEMMPMTQRTRRTIGLIVLLLMIGLLSNRVSAAPESTVEKIEKQINMIEVTTRDDILNSVDGRCSLREAIISANTNPVGLKAAGECEQGSATVTDRIILQSGLTYEMGIFEHPGTDDPTKNDYDIVDNAALVDLQIMAHSKGRAIIRGIGPSFFHPVGFEGWQADRIFEIENATVEFYRLEIRNGVAVHTRDGGGIKNNDGDVTIVDSLITHNRSAVGGGIYNGSNGIVHLLRSHVVANGNHFDVGSDELFISGGGVYNLGELFLQETVIASNHIDFDSADHPYGQEGGGIYNDHGTVTFLPGDFNSEVVHNDTVYGAGLHNAGGVIQGSHFTVLGNDFGEANFINAGGEVNLSDGFIGLHSTGIGFINQGVASLTHVAVSWNSQAGIFNAGGDLSLTAAQLQHNEGSGLVSDGGTVMIDQSQINNNQIIGNKGGGIRLLSGADATITNSSINENSAQAAGGIYIFDSSLTMANSTVSGNETTIGVGGGIMVQGSAVGETVVFINVTVHNNSSRAGIGSAFFLLSGTIMPETVNSIWSGPMDETVCAGNTGSNPLSSNGDNLVSDDTCLLMADPTDQTSVDPQLQGLIEIEGTKMHPPAAGSPALNQGNEMVCGVVPVNGVDQRGFPRGSACDIGAYELNSDD